jgi:integrase
VISLFRCILQCAVVDKKIKKNIFDEIKMKRRQPKKEPHPFTKQEINLLLNNANGWFRNFLAFLFFTGMRIGEVAALDWEDINEESIYVTKHIYKNVIDAPKTYNPRRVPLLRELKTFIRDQKKITKTGRIFPNVKGACSLFYRWHALLRKCGMENNRILYQTRHTFAITALDKGVKISELCYILGHSNPDMLYKHYARYIEPLKFTNFSVLK